MRNAIGKSGMAVLAFMAIAAMCGGLVLAADNAAASDKAKGLRHCSADDAAHFWQWLLSVPVDTNPGFDPTGSDNVIGQWGDMRFLLDSWMGQAERTVTVPRDTELYINLLTDFESKEIFPDLTLDQLRDIAHTNADSVRNTSFELDGTRLFTDFTPYRVRTVQPFSYWLPENNVFQLFGFGTPAGTYYPAIVEGYCVVLRPLSPGEHTIRWTADLPPYDPPRYTVFHLTVQGDEK